MTLAAEVGDIDLVRKFLDEGVDTNKTGTGTEVSKQNVDLLL